MLRLGERAGRRRTPSTEASDQLNDEEAPTAQAVAEAVAAVGAGLSPAPGDARLGRGGAARRAPPCAART